MTWLRINDELTDHPKWAQLGLKAKVAWLEMACHCSRYLTDGVITLAVAKRWHYKTLAELERAGWIHRNGAGWELHDFLDYNPSRAEVEDRRRRQSEAGRVAARARWDRQESLWP